MLRIQSRNGEYRLWFSSVPETKVNSQDHQFPKPSFYEQHGGSPGSSAGHVLMVKACANEHVRALGLSVISAAPEAETEGPDVVGPE